MHAILGIDPGWTERAPSAVSLVTGEPGRWQVVRLAPSFSEFAERPSAQLDDVLTTSTELTDRALDVVCIDMPLATVPINARRRADELVSRQYGGRGCAVHSPTPERPGPLADRFRESLERREIPIATASTRHGTRGVAVEVYPHVLLLALLKVSYRVPYKVGRTRAYWPELSAADRRLNLLREWNTILTQLNSQLGRSLILPENPRPKDLKALEDQVDALVCAWAGILYLAGELEPLGDATAAIWCPRDHGPA